MLEKLEEWDKIVLIYLNNLGMAEFDGFWIAITKFPMWTPLFLLIITLIFLKNPRKEALWKMLFYILMILCVTLVIFLTKEGIGRLRPNNNEELRTLIRVLHRPSGYSFFSGHAASSFSIATMAVLFLGKRTKWAYLMFAWPVLFSFSRIYLGVHYPSDILVGAMVGTLMALLFYRMCQRFRAPYIG